MESVRDTATSALRTLLHSQPTTAAKVTFAWQVSAGQALSRAANTLWLDGVLHVRARDAAWQREIQRARPLIIERLQFLLGPGVVRRVVVTDASAGPSKE